MVLSSLFEDITHHAHIVYSNVYSQKAIEKKEGVFITTYDVFTVRDARHISSLGRERVEKEKKQIYVFLVKKDITRQAQNALLKVCEEPVDNVYFFFFLPHNTPLLDTFTSRCLTHHLYENHSEYDVCDYINMSPADRIAKTDMLWEDKQQLEAFLNALEIFVANDTSAEKHRYAQILFKVRNMYRKPASTRHCLHLLAFSWYDRDICTLQKT